MLLSTNIPARHFVEHITCERCWTNQMASIHRVLSLLFLLIFVSVVATASDSPTVDQQCATEASKLTDCLAYASGQDKSPTENCCGSVTDIKGKDPTCLCLVIRQAHGGSGSGGFSGFHLRLDRLLTLPKACALANASVSDCPKLLNLPPNSPDYAIFTNASYANSSTTPSATTEYPSEAAMKLSCSSFLMIALSAVFFLFFQRGA